MKDKIWNILLTIAMAAVGYILSNALGEIRTLRSDMHNTINRLTSIEASRLTTADGLNIQKQLSDIRESVARIEERTLKLKQQ